MLNIFLKVRLSIAKAVIYKRCVKCYHELLRGNTGLGVTCRVVWLPHGPHAVRSTTSTLAASIRGGDTTEVLYTCSYLSCISSMYVHGRQCSANIR